MDDLMVVNGEVIWDGDDIAIAEGDEAIKQQAYLRSSADEGESVFYPTYGSRIFMYLGKPYSRGNRGYAEQAARDALLKVAGIDEVLSVSFMVPERSRAALAPCFPQGNILREVFRETEEGKRAEYYIYAEYRTKDGSVLKGDFAYVAQ